MGTILHALWIPTHDQANGELIIWAEGTPRRTRLPFEHPGALTASQVVHSLWQLARDLSTTRLLENARKLALVLPSDDRRPLPSDAPLSTDPSAEKTHTHTSSKRKRTPAAIQLRPWRVDGVALAPAQALTFLLETQTPSPYTAVGPSFRFWQAAARLAAVVMMRGQYLPAVDEAGRGRWQVMLVDAEVQSAAAKLAQGMPPSARALARPLPPPADLLNHFLATIVHDYIAQSYNPQRSPFYDPKKYQPKPHPPRPADFWWMDLFPRQRSYLTTMQRGPQQAAHGEAVRAWSLSAYRYITSPYRVAFRLEPPQTAEALETARWRLSFHLQPKEQPEALLAAREIWDAPPQPEMPPLLRAGLSQAAALYPALGQVLEETFPEALLLSTEEAVAFLERHAEALSARGFGVLVPAWWKQRQRRLNLRLSFGQQESTGLLGMQALVDFNWQLAVGDQTLTLEELAQLAQSKTALVQVRGEWMQFDPGEVQAALKLVQRHQKNDGRLALGEALSLALSGPGEWDGLAVESVQVGGWLDALIHRLSGRHPLETLPQPEGFVGQLRPYQVNGLSWLAFLRQYGFGACLADDMGLGKCVLPDTLIFANGSLKTIERLWQDHASDEQSDGEGVWAAANDRLWVNALDEQTGQMVLAPVRRLYRQHIRERVRRVTLEDGTQVTITQRHRLLGRDGWTRELRAGDYVCVPSRLVWEGQPADPDLVKLLAWQIAEGYEVRNRATLTITQKDVSLLEDLKQVLLRLGQRFGFDVHQPAIRRWRDKVPGLQVSSRGYQAFLASKGYVWGYVSRQKSIPDFILQADQESVRLFLRHFFEAEGSVSLRMRSVEISSASPILMQQLAVLLRRFGIWLRVSTKRKRAANGSNVNWQYHVGILGGNSARRFRQEIGFVSERKNQALSDICRAASNTNVEGIPASDLLAGAVARSGLPTRHFGIPNIIYLNGSQQFSRPSLERAVAGIDRILSGAAEDDYRRKKQSKWTERTLAAYAGPDRDTLRGLRVQLRQLMEREVFFCRIKAVEEFEYEGWVYDLEVERHHNFVANNLLCHNTIQVLALLARDLDENKLTQPILLVCPTTVVNNWVREAARFAPQLRCYAHHGPQRMKADAFIKGVADCHLVITSYALLPRDAAFIEKVSWGGVVLDEAHNIKNPATKQAQVARRLNAAYRIALTGTPLENRLQDLWSIMHFLNPGYLGSAEAFQRQYAGPIERGLGDGPVTRLRSLTTPFILRRLKTDTSIIRDLPPKNEMKEYCGLTKEQAALYRAVTNESLRQIAAADGIQRRGIILATLTRLKQVCNHPRHLLGDKSALRHRSGKLNRLTEMLEQALAEDDRVLIFTQYAEMGHLLYEHLSETFGETLYLHGGTPARRRAEMIARFQDSGPPLFVLSLKAGGAGINLTRANRVFHYDRWWNPAVENQATDRAFRIGQTQAVQVHKLICRGTLEERIDELIGRKLALADQVVGAGESWLTELSTDELRDLLLLRREAIDD